MSLSIMIHQMIIIFVLVMLGVVCYKTNVINDEDQSKYLSSLIINVFNPILIFNSVLSNAEGGNRKNVAIVFVIAIIYYGFAVVFSNIASLVLSKEKKERQIYCLAMIFSNLGFVGIPVVNAMFGSSALIYVAVFILNYNFLFYIYCAIVFKEDENAKLELSDLKGMINPGTISCLITLGVFILQPSIPSIIGEICNTIGSVATPVSLMIIGVSVGSQKGLLSYVTDLKQYVVTIFQLLLLPIVGAFIMKHVGVPEVPAMVSTILLGMPTGSLVLMRAKEQNVGELIATKSVVITTLLCLVTLPFVVWLYQFL